MSLNEAQTEEVQRFIRDIVGHPGIGFHREVFADWLEEAGCHPEAAGQRWAAGEGKWVTRSGWYCLSNVGQAHCLPQLFFNSSTNNYYHLDSDDPLFCLAGLTKEKESIAILHYETEFLKRCAEIIWDQNGNPVGRKGP